MARHWSPDPTFTVLLVCTGNICRSALAERLTRAYLDDALGADAALIWVSSAGTQAVVGAGVHPDSSLVLSGFGENPAGHVARQLVNDMAIDADLTLALTRKHRREVLKGAPRALSRNFTLREAGDLVALLGDDVGLPGETFSDRCRSLVKQLAAARPRRAGDAADDVPDPIGAPLAVHQEMGERITESLVPLLDRLIAARGSRVHS